MTQQVAARRVVDATHETARELAVYYEQPKWVLEKREAAWRLYESLGMPDPGDEEWRRTDISDLPVYGFAPIPADEGQPEELADDLAARVGNSAGVLTHDDCEERICWVEKSVEKQKVVFEALGHVEYSKAATIAKQYLYTVVPPDEWKFVALNAALWNEGYLLYVPDNVEVDLPFHYLRSSSADSAALFPRSLVVLGKNARARVIDERRSLDGHAALVSDVTEIVLGDGASLEYYSINNWGDSVYNFNTVRAKLGRDAQFRALAVGLGGKLTKMRLDVEMPESGGVTKLLGITFGDGEQHFDYNTLQNHVGAHTISDLQFKSALSDRASLVWYGITRINPGATASEANQTSRNLLLSEHAKAAPIPILEIEAYDVAKCSHGATAGPVEETELFYLQSRGISRESAERMLVEGFFADIADRIADVELRDRVMDAVMAKVGGAAGALTFDELMEA